jgi:ubiquitin-activating enzyme E1 C
MRGPGLTTVIGGKNKTLYMQKPAALEEATRKNLDLSLEGVLGTGFFAGLEDAPSLISFRLVNCCSFPPQSWVWSMAKS